MKILMFGWEFPPHISGGLGTACYGLTKSLAKIENNEILFVIPKSYGDEEKSFINILGASEICSKESPAFFDFCNKEINSEESQRAISKIEIESYLHPYLSESEFDLYLQQKGIKRTELTNVDSGTIFFERDGIHYRLKIDSSGSPSAESQKIEFTGKYGSNLMIEVFNFSKVARFIAQTQDFDIIHAHDWLTYSAGIAAKQVSGKPLVIHVHATEFDRVPENQINPKVFEIEKAGMEHADRIITVSNLTKNQILKYYGNHFEPKITTVYNGVEPAKTENKKYFGGENHKVVTFLGRITYQKGPEYFIQAACKVLERVQKVSFVMAGNGDLFRDMVHFAASKKLMKHFFFTDFLRGEDVDHMYAISNVYVMPSISEPFGISPLEAMRFGVPVIISKQSGVAEVLDGAIKVDYWDVDELADAIYGVLTYPGLADNLKKSKSLTDNLNWDSAARQVQSLYKNALYN